MDLERVKGQVKERFDYESYYHNLGLQTSNPPKHTQDRLRFCCPFHTDKTPSFYAYVSGPKKGRWECYGGSCGKSGDIFDFIQEYEKCDFMTALKKAAEICGVDTDETRTYEPKGRPLLKEKLVDDYHKNLIENEEYKPQLQWLKDIRGLTEKTIRKWKIGWRPPYIKGQLGRYSIPIYGPDKQLWNIKYYNRDEEAKYIFHTYKPKGGEKYSYHEPHHAFANWHHKQASGHVLICEGEMDGLTLDQYNFPFICELTGAGSWSGHNNEYLRGKTVLIAYDNDDAGKEGADKLLKKISGYPKDIGILDLSIAGKGADITDYFNFPKTREDFTTLIQETEPVVINEPKEEEKVSENIVSLNDVLKKASLFNTHNRFKIRVVGVSEQPGTIPTKACLTCNMDVKCTSKRWCPVIRNHSANLEFDLKKDKKSFITYLTSSQSEAEGAFKRLAEIPKRCFQSVRFLDQEVLSFVEAKVVQKVALGNLSNKIESTATVFYLGEEEIKANSCYEMIGKRVEHPKNHGTFIIADKAIPEIDDLDAFKITEKEYELLNIFRKPSNVNAYDWIHQQNKDVSQNVLKLVGTTIMADSILTTTFSPLNFTFMNEFIPRGHPNTLVVGDTGTGKSSAIRKWNEFCPSFDMVSGEHCSVAGMVGGQKKGEKQDILTPGALPRNTRRAIAIDEFKKMPKEVRHALTQVRSEGRVDYTKIQNITWEARTRILFFSSPVGRNNSLSSYNPPVKAVAAMFDSSNEDVRRTDHIYLMHKDEVPIEAINRVILDNEKVEHKFKSDNFKCLLTYAWTSNANNICITEEAEELILSETVRLSKKYVDKITIVDGKSHRYKLCIGAMNHAVRCFSTNEEAVSKKINGEIRTFEKGRLLIVLPEHVESYIEMFEEHMDSEKVGFLEFSRQMQRKDRLVDEHLDLGSLFNHVLPTLQLKYIKFKEIIFSRNVKNLATLKMQLCPTDSLRGADLLIDWLLGYDFIKISDGKYVVYNANQIKKLRVKCEKYYSLGITSIRKKEAEYTDKVSRVSLDDVDKKKQSLEEDEEDQEGQFDFNTNQWKEGLDEENQADLT
jgi:hypothetical protein